MDDEKLNELFISKTPQDVVRFYDYFETREELFGWMKRRPKGDFEIHEAEGDKRIIVVISTPSAERSLARKCKEEIFKGCHIIFVTHRSCDYSPNAELNNPYFNFGANKNRGIKLALKYDPEWIIYSGDDMYKMDDIAILEKGLSAIDNREISNVFTRPSGIYHSVYGRIATPGILYKAYVHTHGNEILRHWRLMSRFKVKFIPFGTIGISRYLYRTVSRLYLSIAFGILSPYFVRSLQGNVFDETYINNCEDSDLSVRLKMLNAASGFVDYRIGDMIGETLGRDASRGLRDIASTAYFSYKLETGQLRL